MEFFPIDTGTSEDRIKPMNLDLEKGVQIQVVGLALPVTKF